MRHGSDRFWIALSYCGDGLQEKPAQWVVAIVASPTLLQRLFSRPNRGALAQLRERAWQAIAANPAIKQLEL